MVILLMVSFGVAKKYTKVCLWKSPPVFENLEGEGPTRSRHRGPPGPINCPETLPPDNYTPSTIIDGVAHNALMLQCGAMLSRSLRIPGLPMVACTPHLYTEGALQRGAFGGP